MIQEVINILLLEDSQHDQELIKREVKKVMPNAVFTVAKDEATFKEKISWAKPHLILSDYNLPAYTGLDALLYAKEHLPEVPFMFLSGELDDEEAVASAILHGAWDYLLKQNLKRLPEKITAIYERQQQLIEERQTQASRKEQIYLHLQKAKALLEQTENFQKKDEILHELQQAMKEHHQLIA